MRPTPTERAWGVWRSVAGTPVFDRLACDGIRVTHAYVPLPQCARARASMFTGLYPHQHQVLRIGDGVKFPAGWQVVVGSLASPTPLPESVPSLGQAFQVSGYRMVHTGPWYMGGDETPHHGWTDFWRTYRYWKRAEISTSSIWKGTSWTKSFATRTNGLEVRTLWNEGFPHPAPR